MSKRKRILLTNDDGYFADGLVTLYKELSKTEEVYIVAPDREQSGSSHSLTLNRPLRVQKINNTCYTTDGTPTDCVMLALHLLFKQVQPDLIISGINHGANMGEDVTYSGTVAAAIEGSILHVPSLAVSMAHWAPGVPMRRAAKFVARLVKVIDTWIDDPSLFLNINLPCDNGSTYRSFAFTRLGVRRYKDYVIRKTDPRGKSYFWIGGRPTWSKAKGTDFAAIEQDIVSISPLRLNFTDFETLEILQGRSLTI